MIAKYGKRALSFFLSMLMIISLVPVEVLAAEIDDAEHVHCEVCGEHECICCPDCGLVECVCPEEEEPVEEIVEEPTETPEETGESEALVSLRAEIAAYVEDLGITPDMPDLMLLQVYGNHESYEAAQASLTKLDEFEQKGMLLSAEEQEILLAEENTKLCIRYRDAVAKAYATEVIKTETFTPVKGVSVTASGDTCTPTFDGNSGIITVEANGDTGEVCGNTTHSTKNVSIKIVNDAKKSATITFNWTNDKFTISSPTLTASTHSALLESGKSLDISLKTPEGKSNYGTFTLSDIVIKGTVTFGAATNGSYEVDGETVPATGLEKADTIGTEYTLTATPAEGYVLKGWFEDSSETPLGTDVALKYTNNGNATVKPEFVKSAVNVTFAVADGNGSYTVDGETVTAEMTKTWDAKTKHVLVATPESERYNFVGWYKNGEQISTEKSFSLTIGTDILETCTIQPKFEALDAYTINLICDSAEGSIATEGVWDGKCYAKTEVKLTASPKAGHTFVGWTDADGKIVSEANPYTFTPTGNVSVKAVFSNPSTTPWFKVDDTYLINGLSAAVAAGTKIVLAADGTLPAGDYTIPSGVTLLIPFDKAGTLYTKSPAVVGKNSGGSCLYETPRAFCTLTMADGANIAVNGVISLSCKFASGQGSRHYGGAPSGDCSFIKMQNNSNITVNDGGVLYAWGYVIGDGTVTINSGGSVYEFFQFADCRGGSQSIDMDNEVFPLSQYYIQNVEVPMTLYYGAKEYSYTALTMSGYDFTSSVNFIGKSGCMFNLTSGYVVKRYDGTKDRLMVDSYGDITVSPIQMKISYKTLNSKDYDLSINGNITMEAHTGTISLAQDISLLPGAEIIVNEGVSCILSQGINFYIYDADQWTWTDDAGNVKGYCTPMDYVIAPIIYAPSKNFTRTLENMGDAKIIIRKNGAVNASAGFVYTTSSGAAITGEDWAQVDINPGAQTIHYQLKQGAGGIYGEIPITPAKLKNGNGTYMETASLKGTYTYRTNFDFDGDGAKDDVEDGRWHKPGCNGEYTTTQTKAPTCTDTGLAVSKCTCLVINNEENPEIVPALGHDIEITGGKSATCTETGLTAGEKCKREGCTYEVEQEEIPALGHDYSKDPADLIVDNKATCEEEGDGHYLCLNGCGKTSESVTIPALGHNWVLAENPYTWEGYTSCKANLVCANNCSTTTSPLNGEISSNVTASPTCKQEGECVYTATFVIPHNPDITTDDEVVTDTAIETLSKVSHKYPDEWTTRTPASCTAEGLEFRACTFGCGSEQTRSITKLPHSMEYTAAKAASCLENGNHAYWYCSECKIYYKNEAGTEAYTESDSYVIPAVNHKFQQDGQPVAPTCKEEGYTLYRCQNENCDVEGGATEKRDIKSAVDHSWSSWQTRTASTCYVAGVQFRTCTYNCGTEETQDLPLRKHTFDDDSTENDGKWVTETNPSCLTAGEKRLACGYSDCNGYKSEEIPATGHTLTHHAAVAPTCTKDGTIKYWSCSVCEKNYGTDKTDDAVVLDTVVDPAKGHDLAFVEAKAADCLADGNVAHWLCGTCGNAYEADNKFSTTPIDKVIPATGHDMTHYAAQDATCTKPGNVEYWACGNCGLNFADGGDKTTAKLDSVVIDATGHSMKQTEAKAATCFAAGNHAYWYCDGCKVYYKDAAGDAVYSETDPYVIPQRAHDFGDWYKTKEDTCTEVGEERRDCDYTDCEHFETKVVDVIKDHDYEAVVTAPTCTTGGYTTYTCKIDPTHTYTDNPVEPLNHKDPVTGVSTLETVTHEATCTENGYTFTTCKQCDYELNTPTEVASGHALTFIAAVEPTCLAEGNEAYWICSVCDKHFQGENEEAVKFAPDSAAVAAADLVLDKVAHQMDHATAKDATCTVDGNYEYWYCSACEIYYQDADGETAFAKDAHVIPATGHAMTYHEAVAPGCTTSGNVEYWNCSRCEKNYSEGTKYTTAVLGLIVIVPNGHKLTFAAAVPSTCTDDGNIAHWHCSVCDNNYATEDEYDSNALNSVVVAAKGHQEVLTVHEAVAAKCEEAGNIAYWTCEDCGTYFTDAEGENVTTAEDVVMSKLGHTHTDDDLTNDNVVEQKTATCEEDGVQYRYCGNGCGLYKEEAIAKLGHDYEGVVTDPTCTAGGYTTYTCKNDPAHTYVGDEVDALGHDWGDPVWIDPTKTPSCDAETDGNGLYQCGRCGVTKFDVVKWAHDWVVADKVDATCTENGHESGRTCSVCEKVDASTIIIPALGHTFADADATNDGEWVVETVETCTANGEKRLYCTRCTDKTAYKSEVIDEIDGHEYTTVVTGPTCTTGGYTTYTCIRNDHTYTADEVPAKGHSYERNPDQGWIIDKDPTCLTAGSKHRDCTKCDAIDTEEIPATDHSYDNGAVTDPTCTEEGYTTYTCQNSWCNTVGGHTKVENKVPVLKHTYEDPNTTDIWVNVTPDTCTTIGVDRRDCGRCDAFETREFNDIAGHSMTHVEAKDATCTETGNYEYWYCETCKTFFKNEEGGEAFEAESYVIAIIPHVWATVQPETASDCYTAGYYAYWLCDNCDIFYKDAEGTPYTNADGTPATDIRVVTKALRKHDYKVDIIAPTCTEKGYTLTTCQHDDCPYEAKTAETEALGHTYEDSDSTNDGQWTTEKPATCLEAGEARLKCTRPNCAAYDSKVLEATGHTLTHHVAVASDCTTDGTIEYWSCSVCEKNYGTDNKYDAVVLTTVVDPAKGHTMDEGVEAVEATCLTDGNYAYWYCSACETYFKDAEGKDAYSDTDPYVIPAAGHDLTHHAAVASTCTEDGNIEYWSCSVCEKNFGENNVKAETALDSVLDAKDGHSMTHVTAIAATCFAAGNTEHWYCEACDKYFEDANGDVATTLEEVTIAQRTHNFGNWYETKEDTCTEVGEERRDCDYTDCGHFETKVVDEIKSHNYEAVVTLPTCDAKGYTTHTCSHCLDSYKDTYVSELNHVDPETNVNMLSVVKYPATCTEKGYTHTTCPLCGLDEITDEKPATGHALTFTAAVEPTCLAEGNEAYWTCSVCKKHFQGESEEAVKYAPETEAVEKSALTLAKVSHEMTHVAAAVAGCLTDGNHEYWYCSACKIYYQDANGETAFAKDAHVIPAVGHDLTYHEAVTPGCTTSGNVEYWNCSRCEKNYSEGTKYTTAVLGLIVIVPNGHNMTHVTANPGDCTTNGNHEYWYCSACKIYFKDADGDEAYEANAHIITAPGHTESPLAAVPPTCTEKGLTEGVECSVCHKVLVPQRNVKENGHSRTIDQAVAPSCTEPGLTEGAHCSVCQEVLIPQDPVPANGHDGKLITGAPAKCELDGWKDYYQCKTCHEYFQDEACEELIVNLEAWKIGDGKIEMLEHDWGTGRVTTEPECEKVGVRTFTCSLCYALKEEDEPALGHAIVHHEGKKPTYTTPGWEPYETCNRCDEYNTMVSLPALGEAEITNFDDFIKNLAILESIADTYVKKVAPGKDPAMLVIKYIRTGVDRYNSGSWNIMAGYEDADFAEYVRKYEEEYNAPLEDGDELMMVSGLKNIQEFYLPNGDFADIGHVFGSMDITYTNKSSEDHADVSGWAGDTVDLMSMVDQFGLESTDIEGMVDEINLKYFLKYKEDFEEEPIEGTFSNTDVEGDLDAFYVMQQLYSREYENGTLTDIFSNYMTTSLTNKQRAGYFLNNRLDGVSLRSDVRDAVYNEYLGNGVVATLEGTRPFTTENLTDLRKACCYVFADFLCKLAGDFVEVEENNYFTVFQTETSTLAPGIVQKINYAHTADGKTMVYYLATGDITQGNVHVYANYHNNDPAAGWEMQRVIDQANIAQEKYGNPESEHYIENYNVIASINGAGYDMYTGEPSGILIMNGEIYHPIDSHGFFGILDDGTARIGTMAEFNALQDEKPGCVREAIATFGDLIRNGEIVATDGSDRASRTAVGITATGKVVFMVLDGRQGDLSCGGNMREIAQIMLEAGCVTAVNLDGGGSSTYVAKEAGASELSVVSKPSDGISRSVSTSLLMVSTAPDSSAFDRAVIDSEYAYFTAGSTDTFNATAVSVTGNVVDMPEGVEWAVSNEDIGSITSEGVFTAKAKGSAQVILKLDGAVVGSKNIYVVDPDNVYFEKGTINAIYGEPMTLPVRVAYEGKAVSFSQSDVVLSVAKEEHGSIDGFAFTGNEACGLRNIKVTAALTCDPTVTSTINLAMYTKDEASFDFDNASGGDLQLAWTREVSNATMEGASVYRSIDREQDMVTSYTFAMDMSQMTMPDQLKDLTYMLPGADVEGNNTAWSFLLQLAERVSTLTEVTPILYFDKNLEVDYSNLSINNEYFYLKEAVFDEEENSLTLIMKWHRQVKPIDIDAANPMCIVTGITLTPKDDAAWNSSDTLVVVNKGLIAYDVYLRANALYSFSSKPENQEIYGLKPFTNVREDGVQENGGHFESVYKEFEDQYTLINGIKDGWVVEGGGFAYYENGEKYVGICEIDGYYYDFGDNGVNIGQKKYTGTMFDASGNEFYLVDGLIYTGWMVLDMKNVRYYNPETGIREQLTEDEVPSTCLVDGHCVYTSKSGAQKRVDYDDAGGHEYVEQADGSNVCSVCGYLRIEMEDVDVQLSYYICTYNGNARTPSTTATAADGRVLAKKGQTDMPDYYSTYKNNIDVGTASVTLTASKYGKYSNLNTWRGNAAGSITEYYEIRPDLPTDIKIKANGDETTISWNASMAPGVTYVIYVYDGGEIWSTFAETTELTYTIDTDDAIGKLFRIGTYKIVDGKSYESVKKTASFSLKTDIPMVVTGNNADGKPTMSWTGVTDADHYEVFRSTSKNGSYAKVFSTEGTSYAHISAVIGKSYYYKLKVVFADETAVFSDVVMNTCKHPSNIFDITTGNNADGKPTMKWKTISGVDHYEVYRSETKHGKYVRVFSTIGTSYTHVSATSGATYYYKLKALFTDGSEALSDVIMNTCKNLDGVVAISGTITSYLSDTNGVTVALFTAGSATADYSTTVKGNSANFSIDGVSAGTYTMKVSKANHVTREYTVTVGSTNVTQNAKIHPKGDVDGNGAVNILDVNRVNLHYKNRSLLSGYEKLCADVDGNGNVNILDVNRLNLHYKNKTLLW